MTYPFATGLLLGFFLGWTCAHAAGSFKPARTLTWERLVGAIEERN